MNIKETNLILRQSSASTRELTTQARERYSKGGEIFMEEKPDMPLQPINPEHAGEAPQPPKLGVEKPVSAERQEQVRKLWEEADKGKTLTFEESWVRKEMIERGLGPVMGGANRLNVADYADSRLINIVNELNQEVGRIGVGRPLDPRFIQGQLERVHNLVDTQQVNGQEGVMLLTELNRWMSEALQARGDEGGRYFHAQERRGILTDSDERERIFEEIFIGVDANPGVQFETALGLEPRGRLDEFFATLSQARIFDNNGNDITDRPEAVAQVAEERERLTREFSGRSEVRRILHNANWSVSMGGGDIQAFAQAMATFQSEYIDLIFSDPLVGTAMHMFEQAFQQIKAENNGMLPYEELAWDYKKGESKLESRVWNLMREGIATQTIGAVPEWRLRRSIILARGFGVISLRFPEIAATARLPKEKPLAGAYEKAEKLASIYGEAVARYLDPLEHIIEKFNIGEKDRALLYFFLTGEKSHFESMEQLKQAIEMKSHLEGSDKRLIDIINIFRIGGPFSYSSWRAFTSMKGMTSEQNIKAGIGIRETRVSGDVEDQIRTTVNIDNNWKSQEPKDKAREVDAILKMGESDLKKILYSGKRMPREQLLRKIFRGKRMPREQLLRKILEIKGETVKDKLVRQKRLRMWTDALKANPLRVMWTLEAKDPGKRLVFLREALGNMPEDEAKKLLPTIEQDLMVIQENTVLRLQLKQDDPRRITYQDSEMLKYDVIGGNNPTPKDLARQLRVRKYVEKIRQKTSANDYKIIKSFFEKTPVEGSPFPFIIGMEDIPFSDFNFINAGGRGFARRINDFAASVQASNELTELIVKIPTTHNIEPLIESLAKIKQAVSQYDRSIAMQILPFIEEGIIRMYDKEILGRLPLGIGTMVSLFNDTSYAQGLFGREAMTWDEGDKFNFTRHLMKNGLAEKEDIAKLRERVGATYLNLGIALTRTYGQLILLLLSYEFVKRSSASEK